jgi:hypothetical protein
MIKKITLLFLFSAVSLYAADFSYKWEKLSFKLPVDFSQPEKTGNNAVQLSYPKGASIEKELAFIILARFTPEQQKEMNMDDKALLNYAKSTYFATTKSSESSKERVFFGKKVKGDIQAKKIPRKSSLEAYLITLPSGEKLAAGFTFFDKIDKKTAEKIVSNFAGTLSE